MAALLPRPLPAYTGLPAPPARDAPSRLVRGPNCTWPGCSGAPSAVARSPSAQPRRTLRPEQAASSRWVTRGRRRRPDSWVFPTGGSLGLAEAVRPSSIGPWHGPLLSYTLPGYSGRRQQPAGPAHLWAGHLEHFCKQSGIVLAPLATSIFRPLTLLAKVAKRHARIGCSACVSRDIKHCRLAAMTPLRRCGGYAARRALRDVPRS